MSHVRGGGITPKRDLVYICLVFWVMDLVYDMLPVFRSYFYEVLPGLWVCLRYFALVWVCLMKIVQSYA